MRLVAPAQRSICCTKRVHILVVGSSVDDPVLWSRRSENDWRSRLIAPEQRAIAWPHRIDVAVGRAKIERLVGNRHRGRHQPTGLKPPEERSAAGPQGIDGVII